STTNGHNPEKTTAAGTFTSPTGTSCRQRRTVTTEKGTEPLSGQTQRVICLIINFGHPDSSTKYLAQAGIACVALFWFVGWLPRKGKSAVAPRLDDSIKPVQPSADTLLAVGFDIRGVHA
ncbi:hypothetical protein ACIRRA_36810, partial [Nocardia sp. NPDC101769]|uniref:hypothetical protein n=1 Tax=Nocardia sp. NPDC101769 TaxID=3364333 RepID=UPI0038266C28